MYFLQFSCMEYIVSTNSLQSNFKFTNSVAVVTKLFISHNAKFYPAYMHVHAYIHSNNAVFHT